MIANKKTFSIGLAMIVAFIVVLVIFFMPVFNGHNGLNYLDSLYNSISKGSAHFVPKLKEEVRSFDQKAIDVNLTMKSAEQAQQTALLFQKAGAAAEAGGEKLKVSGNMGQIFAASWRTAMPCSSTTARKWPTDTASRRARRSSTGGRP